MTKVYIDENEEGNARHVQFRNPNRKKFLANWSFKAKALLVVSIILAVLLALNISPEPVTGNIGAELPTLVAGYKVDLYATGDDNIYFPDGTVIMFPYSVLLHVDDTSCEAIFAEIAEDQEVTVFERLESDGSYNSWISTRDGVFNSLTEIKPYEKYYVFVEEDCTLDLSVWG